MAKIFTGAAYIVPLIKGILPHIGPSIAFVFQRRKIRIQWYDTGIQI